MHYMKNFLERGHSENENKYNELLVNFKILKGQYNFSLNIL